MQKAEFQALCRGIQSGETRYVEDRLTHQAGRATGCLESGHIEVEVDGEKTVFAGTDLRERWDMQH